MMNKSVNVTFQGWEVINDPLDLATAGYVTYLITWIPIAIGVFVSFFGFSLGIPFDFFTTLQMVHLTPVLWIFIPTSLTYMFSAFSPYNFMPITSTNWRLNRTVDDSWAFNGNATTYNFYKMGFTTNAWLINSTPVLFVLTIATFIHPILTLAKISFPSIAYLWNLDAKWKDHFVLFVIFLAFNIICFNSMMNY